MSDDLPHDDHDSTSADPRTRALEETIRTHAESGSMAEAMTEALEGYGPELLGYLYAMAPSPAEADELYSAMCERLWRGLAGFRWNSSFRTWAYRIARNLLTDYRRAAKGPRGRVVGLGDDSRVAQIAERVRSTTAIHLRTTSKDRLARVRASLEPDDRTLLILRVDRRLSWRDIAAVLHDGDDPRERSRIAARLRKRFERLKERLREELAKDPDASV